MGQLLAGHGSQKMKKPDDDSRDAESSLMIIVVLSSAYKARNRSRMAGLSERKAGANADKDCGCRVMTSGGEEELAKGSANTGPAIERSGKSMPGGIDRSMESSFMRDLQVCNFQAPGPSRPGPYLTIPKYFAKAEILFNDTY